MSQKGCCQLPRTGGPRGQGWWAICPPLCMLKDALMSTVLAIN